MALLFSSQAPLCIQRTTILIFNLHLGRLFDRLFLLRLLVLLGR